MANEAFARVKMQQFLKDADWSLTDGRSAGLECPINISTGIRIADRKHLNQTGWIKMACPRIVSGRHNLLVQMAGRHP